MPCFFGAYDEWHLNELEICMILYISLSFIWILFLMGKILNWKYMLFCYTLLFVNIYFLCQLIYVFYAFRKQAKLQLNALDFTHFVKISTDLIYLSIYFWENYFYPSEHFKFLFGRVNLIYRDVLHLLY